MEFVRSMLASGREVGLDGASPIGAASGTASASSCPFSAMVNLAAQKPDMHGQSGAPGGAPRGSPATGPSGTTVEAPGTHEYQIAWSPEAERRLERIPEFIRPMIRQGIERFATERGYGLVTEDVMAEARGALGM